jgi:hypothetical protein
MEGSTLNAVVSGRMAWVMGWAVPEKWFAELVRTQWPSGDHVFFAPGPDLWTHLEESGRFDGLCGYSLGALILLSAPARAARLAGQITLLAPIWSFASEDGAGGRLSRTELRMLERGLRHNPGKAIRNFYARVGLDADPADLSEQVRDALPWGLAMLSAQTLEPHLPDGWEAWCGSDDPLVDAVLLHGRVPKLRVIPGANHHPRRLLAAMVETSYAG